MGFYKTIDHTADLGIEVKGDSVKDLFQNCAMAFCDIICDITTLEPKITRTITLKKNGYTELLHAFLNELLYLFEVHHELFVKIDINKMSPKNLTIKVCGDKINRAVHKIKTGIKAVTYHQFLVEQKRSQWQARIIFDV